MRRMSVSWQNLRCEQSLVAHGRVKKQQHVMQSSEIFCGYLA